MCGIVGLFLKNKALEPALGHHLAGMLLAMSERGPDSAGIAIYGHGSEAAGRLTLFHPDPGLDWAALAAAMKAGLGRNVGLTIKANHAILVVQGGTAPARAWLKANRPDLRVMGYGRAMDVFKDMGRPGDVAARYDLAHMGGTHGIGHTRMATESAVTTEHSHPFTAADDLCLVHNGSLSNHNRLREWLKRRGQEFETDNDTEVAARYFAHRLGEGLSLGEALEAGLKDLDGFYTFAMGTGDGFAVMRDGIACKPAMLAETDDWVAMSSEYRGLAALPGVEKARLWEPEPSKAYVWHREGGAHA
ncbi:MAG: glutamine amidotransferase family protein [Alphaproteobacteria bacterium]|nr:glutamine amidotransferase family protein [Alphaproteobacteria bacterium]